MREKLKRDKLRGPKGVRFKFCPQKKKGHRQLGGAKSVLELQY